MVGMVGMVRMYVCMYVCMGGWMDGWMDGVNPTPGVECLGV